MRSWEMCRISCIYSAVWTCIVAQRQQPMLPVLQQQSLPSSYPTVLVNIDTIPGQFTVSWLLDQREACFRGFKVWAWFQRLLWYIAIFRSERILPPVSVSILRCLRVFRRIWREPLWCTWPWFIPQLTMICIQLPVRGRITLRPVGWWGAACQHLLSLDNSDCKAISQQY